MERRHSNNWEAKKRLHARLPPEKLIRIHRTLRSQYTKTQNRKAEALKRYNEMLKRMTEKPSEQGLEKMRSELPDIRGIDFKLGDIASRIRHVEGTLQQRKINFDHWEPPTIEENGF